VDPQAHGIEDEYQNTPYLAEDPGLSGLQGWEFLSAFAEYHGHARG